MSGMKLLLDEGTDGRLSPRQSNSQSNGSPAIINVKL